MCEIVHFMEWERKFREMDNQTVHFVKWTKSYIFCYSFHEMDKVMYQS